MIKKRCGYCRRTFFVKKYRLKTAKYCSHKCYAKSMVGRVPWNDGLFHGQVKLRCGYCRKPFWRIKSRVKWGRGRHCSAKCQYASIRARPKKNQVKRRCIGCGARFLIHQ